MPSALARVDSCGPQFKMMDTSFFLARQTLIASRQARHGDLARETVRLDAAQRGKRDGILQPAAQPRRRARQPGRDLSPDPGRPDHRHRLVRRRRQWLAAAAAADPLPARAQPGPRPSHPVPPAAAEPRGRTGAPARRRRRGAAAAGDDRRHHRPGGGDRAARRERGAGGDPRRAGRRLPRPADAAGPGALAAARHHPEQGRAARGAAACSSSSRATFEPRPLAIRALASWRYLDGPWEPLKAHPFRG